MSEQIIIGIPGVWKNPGEIAQAVAKQNKDLMFAGFTLMDSVTQDVSFIEWHEHDPRLVDVFEALGQPWISEKDLANIAQHRGTLWVLSSNVSLTHARQMMKVGQTLLQAGGLGVKVETSGVAHSSQRWQTLANAADETSRVYCAFVNLVEGTENDYSCGMHNFGLPDVSLPKPDDSASAAQVLHQFNQYQLNALPEFSDGDEFSVDENMPRYSLSFEACEDREPEHPFYNPFGRWHLTPQ
jgi:Domain of unknown function (DUF4261)